MTLKRFFRGFRVGLECLLRLPFVNWFNPILTLYLNFRSFPIGQAIRLPVFVYGWPNFFTLLGSMECKGVCRIGMIKFNRTNYGGPDHPGGDLAINNWGTVVFHGPCEIHTGVKINVFRFATLDLGSQCHIMPNCNVTANGLVVIGNNTRLAHRSQIMDSNYHFIADVKNKTVRNIHCPIYIGDCVWICNSVTVSAGAKIPSHTIVSSGSLVNKDFSNIPESSIIGGCPAKLLKSDCRRIYNQSLESTIRKWFRENPEEKIYRLGDCFDPMECD